MVSQVVSPKNPDDAQVAQKALRAACVRMPDREACAAQLAAAMPQASAPTRSILLEILGEMGGAKALDTIGAAVKGSEPELQDTGSRLLGEWMTVDAAPALLDLAKTAPERQVPGPRPARLYPPRTPIRPCRSAKGPRCARTRLDAASRAAEQQLVLIVLERYPKPDTLKVAMKATQVPALKDDATRSRAGHRSKAGRQSRRFARHCSPPWPGSDESRNHQGRVRRRGRRRKT